MKIFRVISILIFIVLIVKVPIFANDTIIHKEFFSSFSGVLQRCIFQDGKISKADNILNNDRWAHAYWPSYDKAKKNIYFFAKDSLERENSAGLYSLSLFALNQEPEKLLNNVRHPSLSTDNITLAFYQHPNQLWIQILGEIHGKRIVSDMVNYQPCVWISGTHLLYIDLSNNLVLLDSTNGEKIITGHKSIVPGALSPDCEKVLCGSSDGKKIYIYSPLSNELKLLKENKLQSIGTSFIWLPDGTGFLFTMQTWSNILKFNESRDLFLYTLSDHEETFLLKKIALFGGVFLPSFKIENEISF